MTLGGIVGLGALALAMAAAAMRGRDRVWAAMTFVMVACGAVLIVRNGLDLDSFVATPDGFANVLGALLGAVGLFLATGLPQNLQDRLLYGPYLLERRFDQAVVAARKPYVDATRVRDAAMDEEARQWRGNVGAAAPSHAWASLADRLSRSDQEWVEGVRSTFGPTNWQAWMERNDRIGQEWTLLRAPGLEQGRKRWRFLRVASWTMAILALGCIGLGYLGVPSGLASAPPQGRAAFVPERPFGHGVVLVPMGSVPEDEMLRLVQFYGARYELPIAVVPARSIPGNLRDPVRRQLAGEDLIAVLRSTEPLALFDNQVVIGLTGEDMYLRFRPEWRFAFGVIQGNVAVISTARMGTSIDWFDHQVERARLRKMVTRYIGFMLYGLPESTDRSSVLYQPLLSRDDLDLMGEDYR